MCCRTLGNGVQNALNALAGFVQSIPGDSQRHVIVVTFILKRRQTNVQIELQELEGGVRATGLLCLLGVGVGLGSFFIYKLYTQLHPKSFPSDKKKQTLHSSPVDCPFKTSTPCRGSLPETPDSGISSATEAIIGGIPPADEPKQDGIEKNSFTDVGADGKNNLHSALHLPQLRRRRTRAVVDWLVKSDLGRSADDIDTEMDLYPSDIGDSQHDVLKSFHSCRSSGFISVEQLTDTTSLNDDVPYKKNNRVKHMSDSNLPSFGLVDHAIHSTAASDGLLSVKDFILVPSENDPADCESQIVEDLDLNDEDLWPEDKNNSMLSEAGCAKFYIASDCDDYHLKGNMDGVPIFERRRHRQLSGSSTFSCEFPKRGLRRNCFSFTSAHSGESSSYEYRESLVSKGFSVDLGEDLGDMVVSPEISWLEPSNKSHSAMNKIDKLHQELRQIELDINYMNEKVGILQSKEDLTKIVDQYTLVSTPDKQMKRKLFRRRRSRSLSSLSRSHSVSIGQDGDEEADAQDFGDLVWDYHSDLALNRDQPAFIACRLKPGEGLDSLDEIPTYLCNEKSILNYDNFADTLKRSDTYEITRRESCGDIYIDDDIGMAGEFDVTDTDYDRSHLQDMSSSDESQSCIKKNASSQVPRPSNLATLGSNCCHQWCCNNHLISYQRCCSSHRNECTSLCHSKLDQCSPCLPSVVCPSCRYSAAPCNRETTCYPTTDNCFHKQAAVDSCNCLHQNSFSFSTPKCNCQLVRRVPFAIHKETRGSFLESSEPRSIGRKFSIHERLELEMNSRLSKMSELEKGYCQISRLWGISGVRQMQTDCYSILRCVVYQALLNNLPLLSAFGNNFPSCAERLASAIDRGHSYLLNWKFGSQITVSKDDQFFKMTESLWILCEQVKVVSGILNAACREQYLVSLLNHSLETELHVLEAVKILMMLKSISLYEDYLAGKTSLVFAWQLFARESSSTPQLLFCNHINVIGKKLQLSQMELTLLGHALSVRIEIVRPEKSDLEDFVVHYPDEGADNYGKVRIIEDEPWARYSVPAL